MIRSMHREVIRKATPDQIALSDTMEDTEVRTIPVTDDGDHDRFAHYVKESEKAEAYLLDRPIRALCGKIWVPSKDPEKYPICPDCKKIYDAMED